MFRLDPELKQPVEHGALLLVAGLIFPTTILAVVAEAMPYPRIIYEDCVVPLTIFAAFGTALSFDTAEHTGVKYASNQFSGVSNQIGSPVNYPGMTLNGVNLPVTGTGAMPLYNTAGLGVNSPHVVSGNVALSSGSATVTLSGSAAFSTSSGFVCSANDATAASAVKVSDSSGTQFALVGISNDSVFFL